jgi:hypothetical protein
MRCSIERPLMYRFLYWASTRYLAVVRLIRQLLVARREWLEDETGSVRRESPVPARPSRFFKP